MDFVDKCDAFGVKMGEKLMELKKSYKGFVVWMICFLVCCFGGAFLGIENAELATRITMNVMTLSIAILTYMIYRNGYIYWYTGITYEEAAAVSEERRKKYAWKSFKLFGIFALVYLVITIILHMCHVHFWVDLVFGTLALIVVAVRTIWFKL